MSAYILLGLSILLYICTVIKIINQMKTNVFLIALLLICSSSVSTSYAKDKIVNLDNSAVVAVKTTVNGSELVSADPSKLDKTVDLPLSFFTEELQIIKLDNRDEALVGNSMTTISDNYILVRNNEQNPYKLFDKKGKFITSIGSYGQGPNEYLNSYDEYIDETNGQILILPWQTKKILRFNLKGEPMKPISLPYRVPKGKIMVDEDAKTVSVVTLPFKGEVLLAAWKQDFNGIMVDSVSSGELSIEPSYNYEVFSGKNTNDFDTWLTYNNSLCHYNGDGTYDEKFTLDFKDKPRSWCMMHELPRYFVGYINNKSFVIDKESLKGSLYTLYNDFLGNMPMLKHISFFNGYYLWNVEPGELIETLETHLEEGEDISNKDRTKLTKWLNSIDENDNNYLFYAKLKR